MYAVPLTKYRSATGGGGGMITGVFANPGGFKKSGAGFTASPVGGELMGAFAIIGVALAPTGSVAGVVKTSVCFGPYAIASPYPTHSPSKGLRYTPGFFEFTAFVGGLADISIRI